MMIQLELDVQQVEMVLKALGELPLKDVLPLFMQIREAAEKQMQQSEGVMNPEEN